MERLPIILFAFLLSLSVEAGAQLLSSDYSFPVIDDDGASLTRTVGGSTTRPRLGAGVSSVGQERPTPHLLQLPPVLSYEQLGIFCKLDVQFERRFNFPVLFRLGDVHQVEAWEGKGNGLMVR